MFDINYFNNWPYYIYFLFFIAVLIMVFLEKRTFLDIIKSFLVYTLLYSTLAFLYIWVTYYPTLTNHYYKKGLYKEVVFNYKKYRKANSLNHWIGRILTSKEKEEEIKKEFILSLYISGDYSTAISFLEKRYKKSKDKESVFWGLYLAHSYMEIGDIEKGKNLYNRVHLMAMEFLPKKKMNIFNKRVELTVEKFLNKKQ